MKLIIAGSRTLNDPRLLSLALDLSALLTQSGSDAIEEVVSGAAAGVDKLGEEWAKANNIPLVLFPVSPESWRLFGKIAARSRNQRMADYADVLLAVWDGSSPGTRHMIKCMEERGKPVFKSIVTAAVKQ